MEHQIFAAGGDFFHAALLTDVADVVTNLVVLGSEIEADDRGAAGRGDEQRAKHPHRRRLAGAIRAEQAENLAFIDGEVDPADRLDLAPPANSNVFDNCSVRIIGASVTAGTFMPKPCPT